MTVAELIRDLTDRLASGEILPSDRVAREWELDMHKEVMFADRLDRFEWVAAVEIEGGMDHPLYCRDAPGKVVRLVVMS